MSNSLTLTMKPGQLLRNRYRIEKYLAEGGFGQTYLAVDIDLPSKPQVVVKLLKPISNDTETLKIAKRLFDTEAETLEKLGKDNDRIPSLYAHFESGGEFYLVQEFIEGMTLAEKLNGRQLSEPDTIDILKEILTGLKTVHDLNKVHRDLKPDNIIIRAIDGKLVLIDFGAVKEIRVVTGPKNKRTICIGTPGYLPKEQEDGWPQFASDIYAVGAIGIQCLTGFVNEDNKKIIKWQHLRQVNQDFAKVLNKMIEPDYHQRYTNAAEALQAIDSLAFSQPIPPPYQPPPTKPAQQSVNKKSNTLPTKPVYSHINKNSNKRRRKFTIILELADKLNLAINNVMENIVFAWNMDTSKYRTMSMFILSTLGLLLFLIISVIDFFIPLSFLIGLEYILKWIFDICLFVSILSFILFLLLERD